jgi:LuxR family transcriptional regulator, maltose regulon positive regulatory protein
VVAALLASKYRVPSRRPNAVVRPRLAERLSGASESALTVVSAPAGFGKTTLLAEWLATVPEDAASIAWLSLDHGDNDAALFWTYVITAIQSAVDGVGATALQLLAAASPSTEAALGALLNDLSGLSKDLVLVLDDYHLIEAAEVRDGMTFLIEHQPPQLHLVLATRADPSLPLARMRARGQLLEIRAADLRFTAAESTAYLNGPMGLGLSDGDVAALDGRTEGWIAALQLAALSMQGRDDVSAFIAGFAGDDRYIVDYLAEEVLAHQPADVREFLLKTSVLERISGPLCDAVTGREGGKATLVALDRANLFLVPLDDRRQWYRYHHLFADVLQAHLLDEAPEAAPELHRRSATWFGANGDISQAIRHALAGGDADQAAELLELAIPELRRERREAQFTRWVRELPDHVVRARPVLGVAFVGGLAQAWDFGGAAERLSDIERSLRPEGGSWPDQPPAGLIVVDVSGWRSLPGHVSMYRAALSLVGGDVAGTVTHARTALSLAGPEDDLTRSAAGALAGLASWSTGDIAGAHDAYTQSVVGLTKLGMIGDVLGCTVTLGDLRRVQGRLSDAVRTYQRALELAAQPPGAAPLRGTADMQVGLAGVLLERNDLAAAAEHLAVTQSLGELNGLPQNPYRWRVVTARLREAEGDFDSALALLDEADTVYVGDFSPNVAPVPAVRARLWIRRGELNLAHAWALERQLSADGELAYIREYEHVTFARLLLARQSTVAAVGLLERLLVAAEEGGRGAVVLEVLVLQALAQQASGALPAALAVLDRAVTLAEPEGFVRLFADEGQPMATLLKALAKQSIASEYARRVLGAMMDNRPGGQQGLIEPLSERELDVLRLLGTDLDGPDIARELFVSLNTMRTHTKNIYTKLGVTNRRAAVRQAQLLKLLPGQPRS